MVCMGSLNFALHLQGRVNYFLVFSGAFIKERTTEFFSKKSHWSELYEF